MADQAIHTRRIGLGVMGWADVLHNLKIPYGSQEFLDLADRIGSLYQKAAQEASQELAREKGICPALLADSLHFKTPLPPHLQRRNITVTCIAPTGGITLLTGNKGFAIEPFFEEANNLSPEAHMAMQAVWQRHVDNCISKTINLPNAATPQDIENIWEYARTHNLKSITVYRDNSKAYQPIQTTPGCKSGTCDL